MNPNVYMKLEESCICSLMFRYKMDKKYTRGAKQHLIHGLVKGEGITNSLSG